VYRPAGSVELRFADESRRVGVKTGSKAHAEFVRLGDALLSELRHVRERASER
jgi:hypothetical protein